MGELDLEPALRRRCPLAENLEDEAGAVDHLGLGSGFEILLLDGRDRRVDDEELGLLPLDRFGDLLDLPLAEQGRRPRLADSETQPVGDGEADRPGEAGRLVEPRVGVAPPLPSQLGEGDDGAGAAGELVRTVLVEDAQALCSWSSASWKLTACSG